MTTKHTPGPWRVAVTWRTFVCDSNGDRLALVYGYYNYTREQIQANAQLIAAAPDLLEACRAFVAVRKTNELHAAVKLAEAAIAAAEGDDDH